MDDMFSWAVKELKDMLEKEPNHTRAAALFTAIRVLETADSGAVKANPPRPIQVGDKVRILVTRAESANVRKGDILTVDDVDEGIIWTQGGWVFSDSSSYERVND